MITNNHPANSTLTSRRLHQMRDILSKAAAQRDGGDIGYAMSDAVKLIDEAIAAFDAKPVAWTEKCEITNMQATGLYLRGFPNNSQGRDIALYTAPPAPVVPDVLPCPVLLEPGMRFGKGVRTQTMLDALQRSAEHHAELEAMTPERRADHEAGIAEFKLMLGAPAPNDGRDQFEEWFKFHYGDEHSIVKLHRANGGANYRDPHVDLAWIAWKDSRSAMPHGKSEPVIEPYKLPATLIKAMQSAIDQLDRRAGKVERGYPQHSHSVSGVWDQSNGRIANEPCSVCALWDEMREYLSAAPKQEVKP